jgi:alpha-beta hydrolase superfamily lysophospholipase
MIQKEFYFNIYHTKFYGQYFQPKNVKAVIVLVHGMGEHSKRYEKYVIPFFNQNSIAVLSYDQYGHGKTEGKRGHNPGYDEVLNCVEEMLNKAKNVFSEKPTFLYGHSMGGNVVINYILKRKNNLNGAIVTSPFLRLAFDPPSWKIAIGKALQKIAPSVTMGNELELEAISRDEKEVEAYRNDPMVHDKISPNYSVVFMKTGEWAIQNSSKLNIPMLLMHGTGDRLTSYRASEEFAKNTGDKVELILYEGAFHELHNDINKNEVIEKMVSWINKQITKIESNNNNLSIKML